MSTIESLCRVEIENELFYCIECCKDDAYLLCNREFFGTLEDGTMGCLAYNKRHKGSYKFYLCDNFTCWDADNLKLPQVQEALVKHFSGRTGGRYNAQDALDVIKKAGPTK